MERLMRAVDLALHRLQVGHLIPTWARPVTRPLLKLAGPGFELRERTRIREEAEQVRLLYQGRHLELEVSRWPQGFQPPSEVVTVSGGPVLDGIGCVARACGVEVLEALTAQLASQAALHLRALPIRRILDVLDKASCLWLDPAYPKRSLAIEAIHRWTGLSREMVIHSIDLEMRSSRKLDLWYTLVAELGNPWVLDGQGWTPTGEAAGMAFGPSLLAGIFSSNIPALPHLTYMRGLAVKSGVIGKVASHEPIFASLYFDTLAELCPELTWGLAVVWFPGGTKDLEAAMLKRAEHVVAYGSQRSLEELAQLIPSHVRRTLHGHRMGIGVLGATELEGPRRAEWVRRVAYDFAAFDGQACLTPAVYFVECDGAEQGEVLAREVGRALEEVAGWLPKRRLRAQEQAARGTTLLRWETEAVFGDGSSRLVRPEGRSSDWAALVTTGEYQPQSCGDRLFHLHCVKSLEEIPQHVAPYGAYLQNVAIASTRPERERIAARMAALGASRVTEPGLMATPSMMWRHDGRWCINDLVRWTDIR